MRGVEGPCLGGAKIMYGQLTRHSRDWIVENDIFTDPNTLVIFISTKKQSFL